MSAFVRLLSAGPLFFLSSWMLMLFAGAVDTNVGIHPFGYSTSMVVTIGLWLTVAPAVGKTLLGLRVGLLCRIPSALPEDKLKERNCRPRELQFFNVVTR